MNVHPMVPGLMLALLFDSGCSRRQPIAEATQPVAEADPVTNARLLARRGDHPNARRQWAEVLARQPHGVFLSNGPGDPAAVPYAVDAIRDLVGQVPLFGICLGHQLLSRALGGTTYKLPFGHHGGNHPVQHLASGHVEITSQNHNFCVDAESLGGRVAVTHLNLNDQTNEGMRVLDAPAFSVQYHPEAGPGPHDSRYLFEQFAQLMQNGTF